MIPGPSFCWWCLGDLQPGRHGLIHSLVRDPVGHLHRVHHTCVSFAAQDGNVPVEGHPPPRARADGHRRASAAVGFRDEEQLARAFDEGEAGRYEVHYVDGAPADE